MRVHFCYGLGDTMADNKTVYTVELQDNGSIKSKTADAKQFNNEMGKSAGISKAVKASYQSYDQARAGVGTGAAGRDFAKESQGLGGLVRVYATFAANIFAVSAAFTALSNAADTANLVKGLDQIGASSGKNLGTLAKKITEVTDGSVSMREAMTATAQAAAAGMSSNDILKMAKGAKQASQALGIDMSDALSRLSRGITKIEPELLDELGIFVRVDKAAQDYATSIGKPVSALTDFEKRASFSTAVLDQLNKKFGSLEIDANPYNQLLASLKNVTTAGLDMANNFLGPVIRLLAEHPSALVLALGAIASTLLKQAIPAIGAWRKELLDSKIAVEAHATETKKLYDTYRAGEIQNDISKQAIAFKDASAAAIKHSNALSTLEGINKRTSLSKGVTAFVSTPTTENATTLLSQASTRQKALEAEITKGVTAARATAINEELAGISRLKPAVDDLTNSNKELNKAKSEYKGVSTGYFSLAAMYERIDDAAKKSAKSIQIVSNAVENAQFGPLLAISMATKEIAAAYGAKQLSAVGAFFTAIKAGSAIAMVGLNTLLAGMSGILNVIGVVVGFTTLLVSIFSETGKEASKFSSAIDDLKASFDNIDRTISVIAKKDPLAQMGIESTQAKANAFMELSDKLNDAAAAFTKLQQKSTNWIDSSLDAIKGVVNMDTASILAQQMAASMDKALSLLDDPAKKDALRAKFRATLGIDNLNKTNVVETLKGSMKPGGDTSKITEFNKDISDTGRAAASSAADLTNYRDTINAAVKTNQEFLNTFNLTDPLAKLGVGLLATSTALEKLKGSSKESQIALIDLMGDTKKMALFGEDFALGLLKIRDAYTENSAAVRTFTTELDAEKAKLEELREARKENYSSVWKSLGYGLYGGSRRRAQESAQELGGITQQTEKVSGIESKLEKAKVDFTKANVDAQKLITEGMQRAFKDGGDYIAMSLKNASEQAAITVLKGGTGLLTGTAALSAQDKLAEASDKVQLKVISVNEQQITIQTKLNNTIETANKLQQLAIAENKFVKGTGTQAEVTAAQLAVDINKAIGAKLADSTERQNAAINLGKVSGASDLSVGVAQGLQGISTARASTNAARLAIEAQGAARKAASAGALPVAEAQETTIPKIAQEKALNALVMERSDIYKDLIGSQSVEMVEARNKLDVYNLALEASSKDAEQQAKIIGLQAQISIIALSSIEPELKKQKILEADKQLRESILDKGKLENLELKGGIAIQKAKEDALVKELSIKVAIRDLNSTIKLGELDISDAISTRDLASGKITEDQKNQIDNANAIARIEADTATQKAVNADKSAALTRTYNAAFSKLAETDSAGQQQLQDDYITNMSLLDTSNSKINTMADNKLKVLDISKKISTQEQGVQSILLKGINDMSDAMVDFAFTGKQSFGDMISSMLLGLAKLQMQQMLNKSLSGVGVGDAASWISNLMGGGSAPAATGTNSLYSLSAPTGGGLGLKMPQAKGGAWDSGVQKFAKGGSFTNSIVNSPTLFKFAQGTGLMGEAGAEAIMPLKRDAQGNLGVRSGQSGGGEVSITVNNFSTAKATTKETKDSRGNRRIEVTVGDMVAGEINRVGSGIQQSLKGTFGSQPQLIRR